MTAWSSSVNPRKASSGSGSLASSIAALRRSSLVACGVLAPRVRSGFGCDGVQRAVSVCFARVVRCSDKICFVAIVSASGGWPRYPKGCFFLQLKLGETRTNMHIDASALPTGKKIQEGTRRKRPRPSAAEEQSTRTDDPRGDATATSRRRIRRRRRRGRQEIPRNHASKKVTPK